MVKSMEASHTLSAIALYIKLHFLGCKCQKLDDTVEAVSAEVRPMPEGVIRIIAISRAKLAETIQASRRLQNASSELADLVPKLQIQKLAFDNGCKFLLLMSSRNRHGVNNMFDTINDSMWADPVINSDLEQKMAGLRNPILRSLYRCCEVLTLLQREFASLTLGDKGTEIEDYQPGSRFLAVGNTKKLCRLIQDLRDCNDIFCSLVWQVDSDRSGNMMGLLLTQDADLPSPIQESQASQSHFSCLQKASQVLYTRLSRMWTCREHETHVMRISVDLDYVKADGVASSRIRRFSVAIGIPSFDGPYHLTVDSAWDDYCTCQVMSMNERPSKTNGGRLAPKSDLPIRSWKVTRLGSILQSERQWSSKFNYLDLMQTGSRDQRLEENLCDSLRRSSSVQAKLSKDCGRSYLGSLKNTECPDFSYYMTRNSHRGIRSRSLDDLLVQADSERCPIPLENRFRLASSLAVLILQVRSSSWLPEVWGSKDVRFCDVDRPDNGGTLDKPSLQVQLDNSIDQQAVAEGEEAAASRLSYFFLGLVLLEIGFSAPLRKLHTHEDITKELPQGHRDFLTVMRLSENVSREAGPKYAKIVRTCLSMGTRARDSHSTRDSKLDEAMFETIVDTMNQCLLTISITMETTPELAHRRTYYIYPECKVRHFVPREGVIDAVWNRHFGSGRSALTKTVVLHGTGGCGKSQIALDYCQRCQESGQFDAILWIDGSSPAATSQSYTNIAAKILPGITDDIDVKVSIRMVLNKIKTWTFPWLIVYDNIDESGPFTKIPILGQLAECKSGHFIFTRRHNHGNDIDCAVDVSQLSKEEGLELLFSRSPAERNAVQGYEILRKLNYLAHAIDWAGNYTSTSKIALSHFVDHYEQHGQWVPRRIQDFSLHENIVKDVPFTKNVVPPNKCEVN